MKKRNLTPKPVVSVNAITVTPLNCTALFGVTDRWFRDFVNRCNVPHSRIGKMVFVDVAVFKAAIEATSADNDTESGPLIEPERELETADDVLAKLGLRRKRGP